MNEKKRLIKYLEDKIKDCDYQRKDNDNGE